MRDVPIRYLISVLSKTLGKVAWETTRIVRDVEEIRRMKQQPGKDMMVLGGAGLVSSLMNLGLIDELRLMINPLILGGGKALFKDVQERHSLSKRLALTLRVLRRQLLRFCQTS